MSDLAFTKMAPLVITKAEASLSLTFGNQNRPVQDDNLADIAILAIAHDELRANFFSNSEPLPPLRTFFPLALEPLANLLGSITSNQSLLDVSKYDFSNKLISMKTSHPEMFSKAIAKLLTEKLISKITPVNNPIFNELREYVFEKYLSLVE
jgi:hypothetical protein